MRPGRAGAVEHFGRGDIVDRAADWTHGVGMEVGERGELVGALLIGQRVIEDRLLGHIREGDVCADVVEVGAIVLSHEEKLTTVAEDGGADAALFETSVLLHDRDVPAVEFPKLGIALVHDFLATGDVHEARLPRICSASAPSAGA